jgi:uncharacterized membrane protein
MLALLAQEAPDPRTQAWMTDPVGILTILVVVLAGLFWFGGTSVGKRVFGIVPLLVFCYFVPTTLTTLGVLPQESPLYGWIKTYLLPASLVLLILALDLPGILRLGPKAVIMLLAGTAGVVIGAPIALLIFKGALPDDAWRGMTALSGSWIGGGANFVALGQMAGISAEMLGLMVIVDVAVANVWMAVLLISAGRQRAIDRWTGADTTAIEDLKRRVEDYESQHARQPTISDFLTMLALAFGGTWIAIVAGQWLEAWQLREGITLGENEASEPLPFLSAMVLKFIIVTTLALVLSFTRARRLDGAGASRVGSVFLYLLVASIGAHANFATMLEDPAAVWLLAAGAVWMLFHIGILLAVGRLIRAPLFFVAVGSQANIGGAASAPIVASAFSPTLAPVGVLLAIGGYVLGTYAGLLCMFLLRLVAGAG